MRSDVATTVHEIVALLVQGEYDEIEARTMGRRLSSRHLRAAVEEYGRRLQMPPENKLSMDVIQVEGRRTPTWSVRIDLWTYEEGRSDLSLELTVEELEQGCRIEVDNLHVL